MPYLTPLELCLETDLEKIGLPFKERKLIYEDALEDYLKLQLSWPNEQIERVKDKKLREHITKKIKEGINWTRHLVYRTTNTNSAGLDLVYSIFPTAENEDLLRSITNNDDFESVVDNILKNRSFWCEEVIIKPSFDYLADRITKKDIAEMRKTIFENDHILPSKEKIDEIIAKAPKNWERGLLIGFYPYGIETQIGSDAQKDIFIGINSPIKDAPVISQRIIEYLKQAK